MTNLVTNANAFNFGIGKQTSGTAVLGTAAYSVPVYSSNLTPVAEMAYIEVTDASSIQGDPYKKPTSWSGTVEHPMLAATLGAEIFAMYGGADSIGTTAGTAYTHTISGLGGTQPFITMFDQFTNTSGTGAANIYGNGLLSELEFVSTADDDVSRVRVTALGSTPSATTTFTATTADVVTNGYFRLHDAAASVKQDPDTPNSSPSTPITNVSAVSIKITRAVTPQPTVDSVSVSNMSQGKVVPSGTMTFLYNSWAEYNASYYGSVTGSSASSTIVYGALLLTYAHSVDTRWSFTLYIPKVQFYVPRPSPDAGGAALTQAVTLNVAKPTSGDHIVPVVTNGVSTAYSA